VAAAKPELGLGGSTSTSTSTSSKGDGGGDGACGGGGGKLARKAYGSLSCFCFCFCFWLSGKRAFHAVVLVGILATVVSAVLESSHLAPLSVTYSCPPHDRQHNNASAGAGPAAVCGFNETAVSLQRVPGVEGRASFLSSDANRAHPYAYASAEAALNSFAIAVFVAEFAVKVVAEGAHPLCYFTSSWWVWVLEPEGGGPWSR
jgi:hypothetical protein